MPLISTLGAASSRGFGEFAQKTAANYIEDVFSTYLYSGSSSDVTINNSIDLLTKGGMVWVKNRTNASGSSAYSGTEGSNMLFDTERGMTLSGFSRGLRSNGTNAQTNFSTGGIGANTNGFTAGYNGFMDINLSGNIYASWTFRKQPKFFDVVTYTGNGILGRTISHNLGSVPGMIIVKTLSKSSNWMVYHRASSATPQSSYLTLQSSSGVSSNPYTWNNTQPTATVFTVGDTGQDTNDSGATYVAYLFAHNAGGFGADGSQNVISCGSYVGDGSGNATVNLGWEPQFLLTKLADSSEDWRIFDTMRGWNYSTSQGSALQLVPNTSAAESTRGGWVPTPTGFTVTSQSSGLKVIYMAIRRGPMRTPTSGTSVFTTVARNGTGAAATVTAGFAPDMVMGRKRSVPAYVGVVDKLRGVQPQLSTQQTVAEVNDSTAVTAFTNTGFTVGDDSYGWGAFNQMYASPAAYAPWIFQRAPGFFDVVCYTGTGSATTISHNLGVAPELLIVKNRTGATSWIVWRSGFSTAKDYAAFLEDTAKFDNWGANYWNTGSGTSNMTSTTISVGGSSATNNAGQTYVAYLFASCPGVSKVGSYTGTGATQTISCGFTGGARYVLIKRTDSTGDWWVWDTARGMVSGTDPRLAPNSTAAETNANWVYTTTGGFQIVTSDATVNASGGSYIFLAIA